MSYVPGLERLFDEAKQQILDAKWTEFDLGKTGQDILPLPDLSTELRLPSHRIALGTLLPTEREQELTWALRATEFVNWYKERVKHNLHEIERHLNDELAVWNRRNPEENERLLPAKTFHEWVASVEGLSLAEFSQLSVGVSTARQFLKPKFNELNERYGMYDGPKPISKRQKEPLTVFINNDARSILISAISPYVDESGWNGLSNLTGLSYRNGQVVISPTFVVATRQNYDYRSLPAQNYHFLPTS